MFTEYCDAHKLTIRERLKLFTHVCKAVQHAHQKGIIHRDIKPSNVLVTMHDELAIPKIIDFGVAKALHGPLTDKSIYSGVFQAIGTLAYMSPEQAQLSGLDIDTRADIYGLGVLLHELLTGTTPFDKKRLESAALQEACRIIREEDPPKISTRVGDESDASISISACRRTIPTKLSESLRGDLDWIVLKSLEKDRRRRYQGPIAFSPDSRLIAIGDGRYLTVYDIEKKDVMVRGRGHPLEVLGVRFFPRSKRIVTSCEDGKVRIWDLELGRVALALVAYPDHHGRVPCVAVHPGGQRIICGNQNGTVRIWDAATLKRILPAVSSAL